jgi:diadenosine tetraphosphate (Ap4A) HIT family hydrolase
MSANFQLHERLAADTTLVCELTLSSCLLMQDSRYVWLILVPRIPGLRDLHNLPEEHRGDLFTEIDQASRALEQVADAYKINVAALGNQVPQLHVHVIARQTNDAAWPGPVWGVGQAEPFATNQQQELLTKLRAQFK